MTQKQRQKEEFLAIQTYEEFIKRKREFLGLNPKEKEIMEHYKKLRTNAPKIECYRGEGYTVFPDGSKMIGGCGMTAVKEKGYKSVEDYEKEGIQNG